MLRVERKVLEGWSDGPGMVQELGVTRSGDLAQSSFYLALTDPRSLGLEIAGLLVS